MKLIKKFLVLAVCTMSWQSIFAQEVTHKQVFELSNPDYKQSPYTGMTRQHWFDVAEYILDGAFSYIHTLDDPMKFPKQPGKTYPNNDGQVPTEKLEGLCRTLFVAAPLLKKEPNLVLNNIKVADYYRHQILNLLDPNHPSYIKPRGNGGPSQILVEFGALAISLFVAPEVIWEPLSQADKDKLAVVMLSYGDGPTIDSNWKFFNIFVLSFFQEQGYKINEDLLQEYLAKSLTDYRGEGWYNDHPAYDYYSMWAYQLYGIMWSEVFGKRHYPEYAAKFTKNFLDMQQSYPYLFDEQGKMVMWGRSIAYRMASIAPFPFFGTVENTNIDLGWLRYISSSTMLQFVQHPEFMKNRVPTLGFYGAFEPAVQVYSCRGSVYWMGKAFLGLLIPENNPFWTATESKGAWETEFEEGKVYNHFSPATNLLITDYPNIGASEVRSWCHEKVASDWQKFRSTENYNRLAYSSVFPWQADGENGEVAMNYVFKNKQDKWEALRLYTFKKFEQGVYYRDAVLETDEGVKIQLAEMPLPNGILRVDKYVGNKSIKARLGHYALPKLNGNIVSNIISNKHGFAMILDNGEYQIALVELLGNRKVESLVTKGLHPQTNESMLVNTSGEMQVNQTYACLMLWKKSGEKWSKEELFPVKSIDEKEGVVNIQFRNKTKKIINF